MAVDTLVLLTPRRQGAADLVRVGQLEAVTHSLQQCRSFDEIGSAAVSALVTLVRRSQLFRLSPGDLDESLRLLAKALP